jgi:hypothetical protein
MRPQAKYWFHTIALKGIYLKRVIIFEYACSLCTVRCFTELRRVSVHLKISRFLLVVIINYKNTEHFEVGLDLSTAAYWTCKVRDVSKIERDLSSLVHTHARTQTHTHKQTHIQTYTQTHTDQDTDTHRHTQTQTHTNTHRHTHATYTQFITGLSCAIFMFMTRNCNFSSKVRWNCCGFKISCASPRPQVS